MLKTLFTEPERLQFDLPENGAGLSDLEVATLGSETFLYAVSSSGGLLSSFALGGAAGQAWLMSSVALPPQSVGLSHIDAVPFAGNGGLELLMVGALSDPMVGMSISAAGSFGGAVAHVTPDSDASQFTKLSLSADDATGIAALQSGALMQVQISCGTLTSQEVLSAQDGSGAQVSALHTVAHNGLNYTFVARDSTNVIEVLRQRDGTFELESTVTTGEGVWINGPTAMATGVLNGQLHVVVASTISNSLTVFELDEAAAALKPADHVLDTLSTRFAQPSHLESFTSGDRVFLIAAGHDAGLSILELLPGGRLQPVSTLVGSVGNPLDGIVSVEVQEANEGARIFVATETAPFLTEYGFSFTNLGSTITVATNGTFIGTSADDTLVGSDVDDTLSGGAGADVLIDGDGRDTMWGGSGTDTFILTRDGTTDRIMDFEVGVDKLDFSWLSDIFSPANIGITFQNYGADLTFGGERLELHVTDGAQLTLAALHENTFTDTDRVHVAPSPDAPGPTATPHPTQPVAPAVKVVEKAPALPSVTQPASSATAEQQSYGDADDIVVCGREVNDVSLNGGDDQIDVGGGNDRVDAGAGDDLIHGSAGFDELLGGAGQDRIDGGQHADLIFGGDGHDLIIGGQGYDILHGDGGDDKIWGGSSPDRLYGGEGNDVLRGGINFGLTVDGLFGGEGDDWLFGEAGFDLLDGGAGDDMMFGGDQADNLYGQEGADVMDGGNGFDRLFGGDGDDVGFGGLGPDALFGQAGNDRLVGGDGDDRFWGGTGNDVLWGGTGADTLRGGAGFDWLIGGAGDDNMRGNFNADTFVFADGHGNDIIWDFNAQNDLERIDLTLVSGLNNFNALLAASRQDGAHVIVETSATSSITLHGVNLNDLDVIDFVF